AEHPPTHYANLNTGVGPGRGIGERRTRNYIDRVGPTTWHVVAEMEGDVVVLVVGPYRQAHFGGCCRIGRIAVAIAAAIAFRQEYLLTCGRIGLEPDGEREAAGGLGYRAASSNVVARTVERERVRTHIPGGPAWVVRIDAARTSACAVVAQRTGVHQGLARAAVIQFPPVGQVSRDRTND